MEPRVSGNSITIGKDTIAYHVSILGRHGEVKVVFNPSALSTQTCESMTLALIHAIEEAEKRDVISFTAPQFSREGLGMFRLSIWFTLGEPWPTDVHKEDV